MANKTLNFDLFMNEKKQEPIKVTVYGKEYAVKPEIPAIVMVTLARTNEDTISDTDASIMLLRAGDIIFGKDAINEFCEKGMRSDQLLDLIKKVFETINGKDVDGEDVEELGNDDTGVAAGHKAKK